jgi:hypothetical protein
MILSLGSHEVTGKTVAEMLGEFLHEVAALVAVFSILDKLVQEHTVSLTWLLLAWSLSSAFLVAGIVIERWRKKG